MDIIPMSDVLAEVQQFENGDQALITARLIR